MKIIVCVKQVPDTTEVRINKETGTLIRDGVPSIINPDDMNAIEAALKIKEEIGDVHITVLCMGPLQAEIAMRETLAMGVDEAVLITDRAFAGSDTWATATILAAAIEKIGDYDIIFCGRQAIDGDTAQVGPEIAEFLGIPQVTYVSGIQLEGKKLKVKRSVEDGYLMMETEMPVLLTTINELNEPRLADARLIYKAYSPDALYYQWTAVDIPVDLTQIGIKNSPTNVYRSFVPVKDSVGKMFTGSPQEVAVKLLDELKEQHVI